MAIKRTNLAPENPERIIDLEEQIDRRIARLVAEAVVAGYSFAEATEAVSSAARNISMALKESSKEATKLMDMRHEVCG